ncbi:alpha/beta fold hydrolase [Cytobacillus sp. FJAT-54145]|uniref:Alpha/beta fold hydrolase n=1 Tax=Cytobacillus spartinae TaxID=3299023 RepID=A0ABW6K7H1_9BACI
MPMLNINGCSIHFNVRGEGVPIIFIHPPTLTSVNFDYQLEELSKNFQVITFDIRGHGKSQPSLEPITYQLIVEDIKRLLDHLEINKALIAGYSTGGSIVLEFLLTSKERALGGIVISGMSEVSDVILKNRILLAVKLAKAGAISVLSLSISWSNSNHLKLFNKMSSEAKKGDAKNIQQYYEYSLHYNCTHRLKEINLPTLLTYGKKDKQFFKYAQILQKNLTSSQLEFIENVDHRIPTKAANELNRLIQQFTLTIGKEL